MSKLFPAEMKSFILDTNAFLRFLLNDNPKQADQVNQLLAKAKAQELEIFVPQIVIFEIEFALNKYYKFPREEVVDKLGILILTPYLKIESVDIFQETIVMFSNKNLDFVDCYLLCAAKLKNSALFTFDKELQKLMD